MPGLTLNGPPSGLSGGQPRFVSNAELNQYDDERRELEDQANRPFISNLAGHLRSAWQSAYDAKRSTTGSQTKSIEDHILDDYRQRDGKYSPEKLSQIRQHGGSEIFMEITSVKCRTAEAQLEEAIIPFNDRAWGIEPANDPELTPDDEEATKQKVLQEIMEEVMQTQEIPSPDEINNRLRGMIGKVKQQQRDIAETLAGHMTETIDDQFEEGGFYLALREALTDLVTTKAGIVKGPIVRKRKKLTYQQKFGTWMPAVEDVVHVEYQRVSPLDLYPSAEATSPDDGYIFQRHRLSREDLVAMIGVDGYDEAAIKRVLDKHYSTGNHDHLQSDWGRAEHENREVFWGSKFEKIEALEFWGSVSGKLIKEWAHNGEFDDLDEYHDYKINAWLVGDEVIKAVLNHDPLGRTIYSVASFERIPGSFWGRGLCELIRDVQEVCNATARALVNNMGISSGPQVFINDITRIPAGENITQMYPWKIWQFEPDAIHASGYRPPIDFYQPNPLVAELLRVFEFFSRLADDYSGIPAYSYGNERAGGAGRTASGLSMLLDQTSKGMRRVVGEIDRNMVRPIVERQYDWNMIFLDDESIKGDLRIVARGAAALLEREQQASRVLDFLNMTSNELDMQLVGLKGRAELLRDVCKAINLDPYKLIKEDHEIDAIMAEQSKPGPEQMMMEMEQSKLQIEAAKAQADAAKSQAEAGYKQAQTVNAYSEALKKQIEAAMMAGGAQQALQIDQSIPVQGGYIAG